MEQVFLKTFINKWNSTFFKCPWLEAFSLSFIFHLLFLLFIWFCCQIYVMFVPVKPREKIIEIEFVSEEKQEEAIPAEGEARQGRHELPVRGIK